MDIHVKAGDEHPRIEKCGLLREGVSGEIELGDAEVRVIIAPGVYDGLVTPIDQARGLIPLPGLAEAIRDAEVGQVFQVEAEIHWPGGLVETLPCPDALRIHAH
jgi:hypothetical protein